MYEMYLGNVRINCFRTLHIYTYTNIRDVLENFTKISRWINFLFVIWVSCTFNSNCLYMYFYPLSIIQYNSISFSSDWLYCLWLARIVSPVLHVGQSPLRFIQIHRLVSWQCTFYLIFKKYICAYQLLPIFF